MQTVEDLLPLTCALDLEASIRNIGAKENMEYGFWLVV